MREKSIELALMSKPKDEDSSDQKSTVSRGKAPEQIPKAKITFNSKSNRKKRERKAKRVDRSKEGTFGASKH